MKTDLFVNSRIRNVPSVVPIEEDSIAIAEDRLMSRITPLEGSDSQMLKGNFVKVKL